MDMGGDVVGALSLRNGTVIAYGMDVVVVLPT